MNDAAETPEVRGEVVLLFDEGNLWRPVPPGTYVERHVALHGFPALAIGNELLRHVVPLLVFAALEPFVCILTQVERVLEGLLVESGADSSLLLDSVAAGIGECSGETEVADSNAAVCLNEDVGRLQVPMHDIAHVQKSQTTEDIIHQLD